MDLDYYFAQALIAEGYNRDKYWNFPLFSEPDPEKHDSLINCNYGFFADHGLQLFYETDLDLFQCSPAHGSHVHPGTFAPVK